MLGCSSRARARNSPRRLLWPTWRGMTLSASSRPDAWSSTRWTRPSPPAPIRSSRRYLSGTGMPGYCIELLAQLAERIAHPVDALDDIVHRASVGHADEAGRAEAGAGHHRDPPGLEQEAGQRQVVGDRGPGRGVPADERRQVGEGVERAPGLAAAHPRDRAQPADDLDAHRLR